jgi:hypothetical protein
MTGARTRSAFDLVDSRRSIANWSIDGAGMGRLPAQRARPSGAPARPAIRQRILEACLTAFGFETERPMPIAAESIWGPIDLCFDRAKAAISD